MSGVILGYRTPAEAERNKIDSRSIDTRFLFASLLQQNAAWGRHKDAHPREEYSNKWTTKCPAFRCDKLHKKYLLDAVCGAPCLVLERKGRKPTKVFCPECGYNGEYFKTVEL